MYKVVILIAICFAACHAAPGGVFCGETPKNLFRCLTAPLLVSDEATTKCRSTSGQCERINCLFRESKWWSGDAVDKVKFATFLNEYGKKNPQWVPTIEHAKTACLGETLKPQGTDLNCPTFDITHCVYVSFIRFASASSWSTADDCSNAREFARSCPVCPTDCYATAIPIGSCNACYYGPTSS
ncbi:uncharacterized protein LOC113500264 [Trichoplusia ni]|uniref:Uncharacterized protein LOC113500264 n=1 Tax=Trichoplusia ni TaxID=7111 RepID=A0A7E5W9B5_TRINI|nr:uncharacterized protein LOC113500264 [Trichoplusia ni]